MLTHKGYTGHIELDDEARVFHGEVLNTRDIITFQGSRVEELIQAFHDSVDDYLEFCRQRGEEPDKPRHVLDSGGRESLPLGKDLAKE